MNIIITGASSGIGKAVAEYLSSLGHQVIGTSRVSEGVIGNYELLKLDVTDDESVDRFKNIVLNKFNQVDVLINNAGYVISGPFENISISEAKLQLDTNYFGVVRVTQQFLPHFRANRSGKIIIISSLAGHIGMPFQTHYSASKFALEGLSESLRLELAPFNIQVCTINPGDFKTTITTNRKLTKDINGDYKDSFNRILSLYEKEENTGSDPNQIAKLIASLIMKSNLNVRYFIGKRSQTISIIFKRIFGAALFEKVMRLMWKIE